MNDLIFDCFSVFWQVAVLVFGAPEEHYETLLACYIMAGVMLLLVLWGILRIVSAFSSMILSWFGRSGG